MTLYYVATTGNDSNNGTAIGTAFLTIQHAMNVVAAGDSVQVASGTYTQTTNTLTNNTSGTVGARILFYSLVTWGAHIVGASITTAVNSVLTNTGDYVDFLGFDVSGDSTCRIGVLSYGTLGTISFMRVHDIPSLLSNGGAGIDLADTGSNQNNDIFNNLVYNIGTGNDNLTQGIYISAPGGKIYNNIVRNGSGYGLHFFHRAKNAQIMDNLCFQNQFGGIICGADGGSTCDNMDVFNNTFIYNGIGGVPTGTGGGINELVGSTGSHNAYTDNVVFGNANNGFNGTQIHITGGGSISGTIATDPLMVNYLDNGSGDYHLTGSSPCIDAGRASGQPATDYDGAFRVAAHPTVGPYVFRTYAYSSFVAHL